MWAQQRLADFRASWKWEEDEEEEEEKKLQRQLLLWMCTFTAPSPMIRCWCARCPQAGYALDSRAAAEGEVEGGKGMSTWKSKRKRKKQWNDATLFFFSFYPLLSAHPLSFSSVHIRTQRQSQKRDNFAFLTITKLIYLNAARSTLRCASYETGTHTHTHKEHARTRFIMHIRLICKREWERKAVK